MASGSVAKSKAGKSARNTLSLKQKYEVIRMATKNPGLSSRVLAKRFKDGKTQISTIPKNKETILELYESNMSSTARLSRKRCPESDFAPINEAGTLLLPAEIPIQLVHNYVRRPSK